MISTHRRIWIVTIFFLLVAQSLFAAPKIEFRTSKVLGLWSFLNSISEGRHGSMILKDLFEKSKFNTSERRKLIQQFRNIREMHFGQHFQFTDYPKQRSEMSWDVAQFFELQSAKSTDVDDFSGRTGQVLPAADHRKMFEIMRLMYPVYEELIWRPNQLELNLYLKKLRATARKADVEKLFQKTISFYNGTWPDTVPLVVYIHPIPARRGNTSATVVADSALVQALLGEKDLAGRFGVVFHEICHGIFESQSLEFQKEIDTWFISFKDTKFSKYTYNVFNESLATAIGNGLVFRIITGREDSVSWYNDREIEGLAKAIYPKVTEYFDAGKKIDKEFVIFAIEQYKRRFPDAPYTYEHLFRDREVVLLTDGKIMKTDEASMLLKKVFRVPSIYRSSPIADAATLTSLRDAPSDATVIIVVGEKEMAQLDVLKELMPKLWRWKKNFSKKGEWVFNILDKNDRPVLIFKVQKPSSFETLLQKIKKDGTMKKGNGNMILR